MELENNPTQGPAIPPPEKPKRKYRKRRKRAKAKPGAAKVLELVSPNQSQPVSSDSSVGSQVEPNLDAQKFDAACAQVLEDAGAPSDGLRISEVSEMEQGPDFEKMVRVYLPKPFQFAALLLEDKRIELSELQEELLVPQGALCLEELWPFLPEFFKNSRFKHTYAFMLSMSLIAGPNVAQAWRTYNQHKQQKESAQKPSTVTVDSAA